MLLLAKNMMFNQIRLILLTKPGVHKQQEVLKVELVQCEHPCKGVPTTPYQVWVFR